MKDTLKALLKKIPIPLSKNHRYDLETKAVIKRVCQSNSNTVDVGCHKGEVLDIILKYAPKGQHFGFEPLPDLFQNLQGKFDSNCHIYELGLSNQKGTASFNYVISNPSYSGLQKRKYDHPNEKDTTITIQTDLLDQVLPADLPIHFIKIDVEGGEFLVLEGAIQTIQKYHPIIVFEHGIGGADCYGVSPEQVYDLLVKKCGMQVSLMQRWLKGKPALSRSEFSKHFHEGLDYYYIAYPSIFTNAE